MVNPLAQKETTILVEGLCNGLEYGLWSQIPQTGSLALLLPSGVLLNLLVL